MCRIRDTGGGKNHTASRVLKVPDPACGFVKVLKYASQNYQKRFMVLFIPVCFLAKILQFRDVA
jgi:hypothetical protein